MKLKVDFKKYFSPREITEETARLSVEGATVAAQEGSLFYLRREGAIDTGELYFSIDYVVRGFQGAVKTNVEYAKYVEYGTAPHTIVPKGEGYPLRWEAFGEDIRAWSVNHPGTKAKPFLRPAAEDVTRDFSKIAADVRRELEARYGRR